MWGEFTLACSFRNVDDHFTWALWVFMTLILMGIEDFFGMNWKIYLVGGTCLGALGEILTSLVSLVKDQEKPVLIHLRWNSQISFLIRV